MCITFNKSCLLNYMFFWVQIERKRYNFLGFSVPLLYQKLHRFYCIQQVNTSWVIYDFSHMFICLLWFCHGLPKGEIVRTYVIHLLGTYVIILYNWLILWQNTLYLYLGRSGMCLILQETVFQDQVLKPCKSVQETIWKVPVIKARQLVIYRA